MGIAAALHTVTESAGVKYPLRAASHSSFDVDLGTDGWTKELMAVGFDPKVPTVWIAEGLFMYLSEDAVTALLKEARSVSAKGSRFLIMVTHVSSPAVQSAVH